jgi:hypothetical protein
MAPQPCRMCSVARTGTAVCHSDVALPPPHACMTCMCVRCRSALLSMLPRTWHPGSEDRLPFDVVLVVNKMDVLPRTVSHGQVEQWVRARCRDAGLPKPKQVHLVSSVKQIGMQRLLRSLIELVRAWNACNACYARR